MISKKKNGLGLHPGFLWKDPEAEQCQETPRQQGSASWIHGWEILGSFPKPVVITLCQRVGKLRRAGDLGETPQQKHFPALLGILWDAHGCGVQRECQPWDEHSLLLALPPAGRVSHGHKQLRQLPRGQ